MSWRDVLRKTTIPPAVMDALNPVIEGQRLFNLGQYAEARAMYTQALNQFPPKSGGRVLIYNKLGILYEKMGEPQRALDSYEKSVKEGALRPFTYQRLSSLPSGGRPPAPGIGLRPAGHQSLEKGPHQCSPGDLLLVYIPEAKMEDQAPHFAFRAGLIIEGSP